MVEIYKLRCTLSGHKSDVRAVTCPSDTEVVSASRDLTARTWHISKEGCDGCENMVLLGHTNYVSAVCYQELDNECRILTGSHDKLIRVYNFMSPEAIFTLKGHEDTVCALAPGSHKTIVSGSWDKSIKIWKDKKCVSTLSGHEAAVWCVLVMSSVNITGRIDDLIIVSGSADRTIRIWCIRDLNKDTSPPEIILLNSLCEHKDCVRALACIDDSRFLSASNDASIRAWDATTGVCIGEFYGHTNFIYGLASLPSFQIFVSCGEDRSIRVWRIPPPTEWFSGRHFSCFQTILLPCQSAWCVAVVPNGDIVVGGSDSMIRIFSCDPKRQATVDTLKLYETELANFKITVPSSSGDGDLVLNNLPGVEALTKPGKSEGQIMVINDGGRSVCYQWSSHDTRWIEVGDVVGTKLESLDEQSHIPLDHEFLEACRNFDIDNCNEDQAVYLTTNIIDVINKWTPDIIFPLLDILRCLVFWQKSSDIIFETSNWNHLLSISFDKADLSSANCLLILRLLVNCLAADCPRFIDIIRCQSFSSLSSTSAKPKVPRSLIATIGVMGKIFEIVNDNKLQFITRKQHQVAFSNLVHNLTVLAYLSKPLSIESNISPQLRSMPGVCIRTSLNILSLALDQGCSGVTQLHPSAVYHLFVSLGTCLLLVTSGSNSTDEQSKTQRIRVLASAMIGLKDLPLNADSDKYIDTNVDEFTGWESARKIINYWITTPTACPNVRGCASQLLSLLE
ncbi:Phospholipase A-2-activating protein [Schistosoma japonicum]|nr:Phospholipase A-2-activating protein [Schistosoma japonicum]